MGRKSRNNYASRTPVAQTPSTEETTVSTPEVIEDTLTPKQPVETNGAPTAETPAQEEAPAQEDAAPQDDAEAETPEDEGTSDPVDEANVADEPVEETIVAETENETPVEVDINTNVDPLVAELNAKLAEFKSALEGYGKTPEDFKDAAKKAAGVTKFVLKNAKPQVLDALLAFFVANKDGVATPAEVMKGSTTLPRGEEQQVGFLFNLFMALANRRVQNVNNSAIINVLRKPEIASYYLRKANGIRASKA